MGVFSDSVRRDGTESEQNNDPDGGVPQRIRQTRRWSLGGGKWPVATSRWSVLIAGPAASARQAYRRAARPRDGRHSSGNVRRSPATRRLCRDRRPSL